MSLSFCVIAKAFLDSLYPPESNHHLPLDALRRPEVRFLVARDAEGKALATGAIVLRAGWGRYKVNVGRRGCPRSRNSPANSGCFSGGGGCRRRRNASPGNRHGQSCRIGSYEKTGFKRREPFGDYRPEPRQRLHGTRALTGTGQGSRPMRRPPVAMSGRSATDRVLSFSPLTSAAPRSLARPWDSQTAVSISRGIGVA